MTHKMFMVLIAGLFAIAIPGQVFADIPLDSAAYEASEMGTKEADQGAGKADQGAGKVDQGVVGSPIETGGVPEVMSGDRSQN